MKPEELKKSISEKTFELSEGNTEKLILLHKLIDNVCEVLLTVDSREMSIAKLKLEEVSMWATRAIIHKNEEKI